MRISDWSSDVCSSDLSVRTGPLPTVLTLAQALEEAQARSPVLAAARADVEAARGRLRQAGFRFNPVLNVEVENFAGTGPYSGFNGTETTVSINQRLDLAGRRRARMTLADAADRKSGRVGKECVSRCRARWWRYTKKKKHTAKKQK